MKRKELELYIHIPFCVQKCKYCDFLSAPSTLAEREFYVDHLVKKIESYNEFAKDYVVRSIFIGGGTPTTLSADQTKEMVDTLRKVFDVSSEAEITTEMNPGTVTRGKLECYKNIGINRLSIGLQSTIDEELKTLGRIHNYEDFLSTYHMAREVGFENINVDLMSAIPGQNRRSYETSLRRVAQLHPEHISAYSLIIEEGTPFYELYGEEVKEGVLPLPDEDTERQMYQDTRQILLEYGYHRYEISNYAKNGKECIHNLGYWDRVEYLGIGFGAASLIGNRRFSEPTDCWDFLGNSEKEAEILTKEDEMSEFMFLGLRKIEGVSKRIFFNTFGISMDEVYPKVIDEMKEKGLLTIDDDRVKLTDRGLDISNFVMSEFLI